MFLVRAHLGEGHRTSGEGVEEGSNCNQYGAQCSFEGAPICVSESLRAAGAARLYDLDALDRRGIRTTDRSPLQVFAQVYRSLGLVGLEKLSGDFGVVIWDSDSDTLIAITDALGLESIYYKVTSKQIVLSNRADKVDPAATINPSYAAEFMVRGQSTSAETIWAGVKCLPPGSHLVWRKGTWRITKYWDPAEFHERSGASLDESASEYRRLFQCSIEQHLRASQTTWADLSGGHDSSSVVAMAAHCSRGRTSGTLGGSITWVDSLGDGDETAFTNAVVRKHKVRNEKLIDVRPWSHVEGLPAVTDMPARDYPFSDRDRLIARILKGASARVLLSGCGPDICLPFTPVIASDLMWTGRFRKSLEFVFEWTLYRNEKIWSTFPDAYLRPLIPAGIRRWQLRRKTESPSWMRKGSADTTFRQLRGVDLVLSGSPRHLVGALMAHHLRRTSASLSNWRETEGIEIRHPFLYRPLVEFSLQLPLEHRTQPNEPKVVLRHALRDLLPNELFRRRTKGSSLMPRITWAMGAHRQLLRRLIQDSTLADLGLVEPKRMLAFLDSVARGKAGVMSPYLYYALSLETWFAVRTGRYERLVNNSQYKETA